MDCYHPEQTPTAALKSDENHAPNTAAASYPDLAITPKHNSQEETIKSETVDIDHFNNSDTTTSQNPTSNAPSPEPATLTNSPKSLEDIPPSKDADTKIGIKDPTDQIFIAALMSKKDNPTPISRVESPGPKSHEAATDNEVKTEYSDQRKNTDESKSTTTPSNVMDLCTPPPEASTEPKTRTETTKMTAPSKPQPAAPLSDADMVRKANAESKSPLAPSPSPSPSLSMSHLNTQYSFFFFYFSDKAFAEHKHFFEWLLPSPSRGTNTKGPYSSSS